MRTHHKKSVFWLVLLLASLVSFSACGDDAESDESDAGETPPRAGRGGRGGSGGKGGSGAGDDDAGTAGKAGGGGSAGKGGSGGNACYDGEPKETKHYLNRCTDSECEPFDNKARLPLLDGDKLPSLP